MIYSTFTLNAWQGKFINVKDNFGWLQNQ